MRYFIEISYKGTAYSGFQIQKNANSIQAEIEKALQTYFRQPFLLTGASRTDAGVHALQNFFHFDTQVPALEVPIAIGIGEAGFLYNLNAILPCDIVIKRIFSVSDHAHCRFDALSREYKYFIYQKKDPFLADGAYFYPYSLDSDKLNQAAAIVLRHHDFTSFSKRNTQVKNFICDIMISKWTFENDTFVYHVKANRFLRGMVKGLVGTMLRVGTGRITLHEFSTILKNKDCAQADFSVPPHALFLVKVNYGIF